MKISLFTIGMICDIMNITIKNNEDFQLFKCTIYSINHQITEVDKNDRRRKENRDI